ncbi:uncharacterized protein LAESUDRAFT_727366 [Laetiporus sulphureus 93-53]|uniref:Copper transport protein n=1 Tax=Laetiporus sulphureus 93-53 TaxID=1314785 RepID=A0A165DKY2_9APHY|nr:uncharacterized protein LAESUDRAFT_727366 [Laetiporus sulphureus 93-53]KZT05109.1 hypothetical protein LAESUDRAFT_727366 [Laetiporus sulphureus 93-53]
MDMSMDDAINLASGEMLPYLHFTPGDILWFQGWVPSSAGAMVGTCIGLLLLAMVERWIAAARAVMNYHWSQRAYVNYPACQEQDALPVTALESESKQTPSTRSYAVVRSTTRILPPFVFEHDVPRGIFLILQAALSYAFMLVVMTWQLGFIFSILVGLGIGEMLFGRFANHDLHLP